jgi:hypothetical protein
MDDSRAESANDDAELDAIAQSVRSAQRHNLLLKIGVCFLPVGGCVGGAFLQGSSPNLANAWLLFGGIGLAVAVALLKKFERPIPE